MRKLGLGLLLLLQTGATAWAQQAQVADALMHGPGRADGKAVWLFDPASGVTLGTGVDLACMKADLIFEQDGRLAYADPSRVPRDCAEPVRTGARPLIWAVVVLEDSGVLRLRVDDGDRTCAFAVRPGASALTLTTSCGQVAGQPRQFRYFPTSPDARD